MMQAIDLHNRAYLRRVGMDRETGKLDIDIIATGISHSQHDRMRILMDIIQRIGTEAKDGNAMRSDIIHDAEAAGLESVKVEEALDRLKSRVRFMSLCMVNIKLLNIKKAIF